MLNLLGRIKFHRGRFSFVRYFSSDNNFFLLQLSRFSSYTANSRKPISEKPDQDSFSATYLKNKFGFSPEKAAMYSKYVKFDSSEKPESVVAFFKNHDFSDAQISLIVRKWPLVFIYVPESNFLPKIEFFRSLGFSSSDIVRVLTLLPNLLERSLEAQIIPCVDFLRRFLNSEKDLMFSLIRYPGLIRRNLQDILLPNVEILRGAGVPDSSVAAFLKISCRGLTVYSERFRATVEEVQKLGLNPRNMVFIRGIIVRGQLSSSTWEEKINFYKGWGFSEDQVLDAFRKAPYFMAASMDKATRVLDLLVNKMAVDVHIILKRPQIILLSVEKTIAPRCAFYQFLLSKSLIKQSSSLSAMLACSHRLFFERYVRRFEEIDPELIKQYQEIFSNSKA